MEMAEVDQSRPVFVADEPHYLRAEAMRRLRKDRTTLYRWAKAGKITQRSYLGWACYPVEEVLQLQAENDKKEHPNGR